jgi:anti-sigma-K factor RskA
VTPDERQELLFLYAAGALEGEERDEVEAWLERGGADARAALAQAEQELAGLARALAPVAPGPAVAARLRARIDATAARRASGGWGRAALAAGLTALVAGGIGYGAGRRLAERDAGARLAALEAELSEALAERDEIEEELAEQEAAFRHLESEQVLARKTIDTLSADRTEALTLAGTPNRPEARARVYWDWDTWYCYLRAEGLSPDPDGVYALWLFTDDGDVIGVGAFGADAEGRATLIAPVPHDVGHVVRAGVSIEPDDRLGPGPSGEVVLLGSST